jgi:hypothetical protein
MGLDIQSVPEISIEKWKVIAIVKIWKYFHNRSQPLESVPAVVGLEPWLQK